jgi:cytoskeletal protein RodZ
MAEQEESLELGEKRSAEDADAVSMQDLEMIFAPGKQPPPSLHRGAEGLSHASESVPRDPAQPAKEIPKPPRPPRKAAAPPDIGAGDLAAFAALGGSIPAPPHHEGTHEPDAHDPDATPGPSAVAMALAAGESKADGSSNGTSNKDVNATTSAEATLSAEATPIPESKRLKARVLPRLRKPLPLPFPDSREPDDWKSPPSSALQDLKRLTSSNPPRRKNAESVDFDALLGMKNSGLSGSLSAPIVPPDLAKLVNDAPGESEPARAISGPPRPKKKNNSDAIAAAVTAHPGEPARRKKKGGPQSTRAPRSSSGPVSETRSSKSPPKVTESPSRAPVLTKEEKSSRTPLYVLLAAAILGGGYLLLRGPSTPTEAPKADQPTATPTQTAESKPAQATPTPVETATAVATSDATTAPTASAPTLFGAMPHPSSTATSAATTPATSAPPSTAAPALATAAPTAKPAVAGTGDFDRGAASAALGGVVGQAAGCKQSGDPSGTAHVQVTFAPSGHVTVANVSGPPFAGTATGGCIARSFKTASIPPFSGDPVTVSKTVQIP